MPGVPPRFRRRSMLHLLSATSCAARPVSRRDALRESGKPLNRHAPGQRSLSVMENRGRGGVRRSTSRRRGWHGLIVSGGSSFTSVPQA